MKLQDIWEGNNTLIVATDTKDDSTYELDSKGEISGKVRFKGMERVFSIFPGAAVDTSEQEGIGKFSGRMNCALAVKKLKIAKWSSLQ